MPPKPPEPVAHPKLAVWMFERKLGPRDAASALSLTPEAVRRYCLEFGHAKRQIPGRDVMARIVAWTEGEVTPNDFHPPHLTPAPAAAGAHQ